MPLRRIHIAPDLLARILLSSQEERVTAGKRRPGSSRLQSGSHRLTEIAAYVALTGSPRNFTRQPSP
ncbi:hypothetical protein GOB93_08755 [Acetobacter musti]|uniref:Transposase n=1 Tax=Acetobacter musti TaxID=864732 RepID=A0ABX0JMW4_9PROT|nr:hypothetical protein [Acetobacter musti]NHN84731.1 hypothetical protein [Acetobacter musti]